MGIRLTGEHRSGEIMGTRIGYVAGAFDEFDVEDLNALRYARKHCDALIVGVVSDEIVRTVTGAGPVVPLAERAQLVRGIGFIEDVHLPATTDPMDAWRARHFTRYFKGDDWCGDARGLLLEEQLGAVGVSVIYLPHTAHRFSAALWRALDAIAENAPAVVG